MLAANALACAGAASALTGVTVGAGTGASDIAEFGTAATGTAATGTAATDPAAVGTARTAASVGVMA